MTIYILHDDCKKIAEYLDDKSLDRMIKDIAQVLCNVHCSLIAENGSDYKSNMNTIMDAFRLKNYYIKTPLGLYDKWSQWARECVANYEYLVELGLDLCDEWELRFTYEYGKPSKHHKIWKVLVWARNNVPDLPSMYEYIEGYGGWDPKHEITQLPLVMPKKYISYRFHQLKNRPLVHESYRDYYRAKITTPCDVDTETLKKYRDECGGHHMKDNVKWTRREKPYFIGE